MKRIVLLASIGVIPALTACGRDPGDGPPEIALGDSVCARCNMIISDERFATATIVRGPRGAEPRLFDDFNCQALYEAGHPEEEIVARWSHAHDGAGWIRTETAHFLTSAELRTPMGSRTAAFTSAEAARAAQQRFSGEVIPFGAAWGSLRSAPPGAPAEAGAAPEPDARAPGASGGS